MNFKIKVDELMKFDREDLFSRIAVTLAAHFTSTYGSRNPEWDIDGPDDDTNPYYLPVSMEERVQRDLMISFTDTDGYPSMRPATIPEVVEAVIAVAQPELDRLRVAYRSACRRAKRLQAEGDKLWDNNRWYAAEQSRLIGQLHDLRAELAGMHVRRSKLVQLLGMCVDTDECRFDHHGCCQTHGLDMEPGEQCPMIEMRQLVGVGKEENPGSASEELLPSLVDARRRRGLTVEEVAERMGTTPTAVTALEEPGADPRMSTVRRYALAVGVRVEHEVETLLPGASERVVLDDETRAKIFGEPERSPFARGGLIETEGDAGVKEVALLEPQCGQPGPWRLDGRTRCPLTRGHEGDCDFTGPSVERGFADSHGNHTCGHPARHFCTDCCEPS